MINRVTGKLEIPVGKLPSSDLLTNSLPYYKQKPEDGAGGDLGNRLERSMINSKSSICPLASSL
jgi:hypothetical protein